jgi:hypothetical protein
MRSALFCLALNSIFMLGSTGTVMAGQNTAPVQNQGFHAPRTIDQELDPLTKGTRTHPRTAKGDQTTPIPAPTGGSRHSLIKSTAPRESLSKQIHGISDQKHHKIDALLTHHQKQLAEALQERMHNSEKTPPS